jgi:hypothetical protein
MAEDERETGTLIGSDKVEGTAVYGNDATRIGSIERVMIEKVSGKVAYAVLSFGGFLGIGEDHYPLPWQSLTYNTELGGYQVANFSEDRLNAPRYGHDETWDCGDPQRARGVSNCYGIPFTPY